MHVGGLFVVVRLFTVAIKINLGKSIKKKKPKLLLKNACKEQF